MTQPMEWIRAGIVIADRVQLQALIAGETWRHTRPHWFSTGLMVRHDSGKSLGEYEHATLWLGLAMFQISLSFSVPESWRQQPPPRSYRPRAWWSCLRGTGWRHDAGHNATTPWAFRISV